MGIIVTIEGVENGYLVSVHEKDKSHLQKRAVFKDLSDAFCWTKESERLLSRSGEHTDSCSDAPVEVDKNDRSLNTQIAIALDLPYGKSYTTNPVYMMHVIEALAKRKIAASILQEPYQEKLGSCGKPVYLPYYTVTLWHGPCGFTNLESKTYGTSLGYMVCAMALDILNKIKDKEKKCQ